MNRRCYGNTHHEPCMRAGAEYGKMRGEDSPYGDAWSFLTNEEGITNFWRDGLIRNRSFENVITMGMRGENDTAILGADATMEDNVNLLRRVLKTQNQLIRETINENLDEVPRMMVLFTEVEAFFYGDEKTKGLLDEPELEGVTLMLSDNNQGCSAHTARQKRCEITRAVTECIIIWICMVDRWRLSGLVQRICLNCGSR